MGRFRELRNNYRADIRTTEPASNQKYSSTVPSGPADLPPNGSVDAAAHTPASHRRPLRRRALTIAASTAT
jgi:hypothetical protein